MSWPIFVLLLSIASAKFHYNEGQFLNMTVWQAFRHLARHSDPEFIAFSAALQSSCAKDIISYLDDPNQTLTVFAPTDMTVVNFFDKQFPLRMLYCEGNCTREALQPFPGTRIYPTQLRGCVRELVSYHVVPDIQFVALQQTGNVSEVVTVLPTMLNSTSAPDFVKLAEDLPQSLIVNQTSHSLQVNQFVNYGGTYRPARIIHRNIRCLNGFIQGIDRLLIPPASAFRTIQAIDPRGSVNAFRTEDLAQPVTSLSNITMFWPVTGWSIGAPEEAVQKSLSQLWNYTEYIVPDRVLFNNQTTGMLNVQMINGAKRNVTFDSNYDMRVDGINVLSSNILIENGILHLIERPFPTNLTFTK